MQTIYTTHLLLVAYVWTWWSLKVLSHPKPATILWLYVTGSVGCRGEARRGARSVLLWVTGTAYAGCQRLPCLHHVAEASSLLWNALCVQYRHCWNVNSSHMALLFLIQACLYHLLLLKSTTKPYSRLSASAKKLRATPAPFQPFHL